MRTIALLIVPAFLLAGCTEPTETAEYQQLLSHNQALDENLTRAENARTRVQGQYDQVAKDRDRLTNTVASLSRERDTLRNERDEALRERDAAQAGLTAIAERDWLRAKLAATNASRDDALYAVSRLWDDRNLTAKNLQVSADQLNGSVGVGLLIQGASVFGKEPPRLTRCTFCPPAVTDEASRAIGRTGGLDLDLALAGSGVLGAFTSTALDFPGVYFDPDVVQWDRVLDTDSMEPTIHGPDDVVILYKPTQVELQKGDIVIYEIPADATSCDFAGQSIIHRIIALETGSDGVLRYKLQGDNNASSDDCLIPFNMVKWKVLGILYDSKGPS